MLRTILVIHRYIGVVLGGLMALWCLSGFVMMYQSMPELSQKERLGGLQPLSLAACCNVPSNGLADDMEVSDFRIEMLGGRPVLHLSPAGDHPPLMFDLATGAAKDGASLLEATASAALFGKSRGVDAPPKYLGEIAVDQWTLQTARRNQPAHKFRFADSAATEVYVSGATGAVFQDTTRKERILAWLGAIPHWLYPTVLRQNGKLWTQVVVWTSTIGVFLTITGLYVGIMRFRRQPNGKWSPFKGWWYWHHMFGLFFGILTLTWVFSGLLTMNPWGLLEGADSNVRKEVVGTIRGSDVKRVIAAAPRLPDGRMVQLSAATLGGQPYVLAADGLGEALRHDVDGQAAPLQESEVRLALAGQPMSAFSLLETEDSYHYAHHTPVPLPVYRAILADEQKTRVYVDAVTGRIVRMVDGDGRKTRWLSAALHDFDLPGLRARPVWDLVVIPLLLGVTAVCVTGTWLGVLRIGRDAGTIRVMLRRRRRRRSAAPAVKPSAARR